MKDIIVNLDILIDTLKQKEQALKLIDQMTMKQKELIESADFEGEQMTNLLRMKQTQIDKVNILDDGFVGIYNQVKIHLNNQPSIYETYIKTMQTLIKSIGELGIAIQVGEMRNSRLLSIKQTAKGKQMGNEGLPASKQLAKNRIDAYSKHKKQ